jgi:hypothetical protein
MIMAGKIFYRERRKVGEGEKKPRYTLVAVTDIDLTFYPKHMRKQELEQIAEAVGAELVLLTHGEKEKEEEVEVKE